MSQFTFFPASGGGGGYAQLYDDDTPTPSPIGSPVAIAAGATVPVTAPHGTVKTSDGAYHVMDVLSGGSANLPQSVIPYQDASGAGATTPAADTRFYSSNLYRGGTIPRRELKDSASAGIGIYASLDGLIDDTIDDIPDSAVTVNGTSFASVKATQGLNVPVKDDAGTNVGVKVGSDWVVKRDPMKVVFPVGSTDAYWVITADEAGSYISWTDDGSSGTLTYRTGGSGTYIAATGTIALTIGTIIEFKRTVSSAIGYWRWAH